MNPKDSIIKIKEDASKEKITVFKVYEQDGQLHAHMDEHETRQFELYGFLKLYIERLEEILLNQFGED